MNVKLNDFEKFAVSKGIGTGKIDAYKRYVQKSNIISPTIIEERPLNIATMDVFSALIREKIIYLSGVIDEDTASIINGQLLYLNSISDKNDKISLFISSPGGSVISGLSIYDLMNYVSPKVATYCMGMAASMGSILLSSGEKGMRYCLPNSRVMMHQVSTATGRINTADLKIEYEETKLLQDILFKILAENTGKTFKQIEKDADRDKWFSAEEAMKYGLVDAIITKKE